MTSVHNPSKSTAAAPVPGAFPSSISILPEMQAYLRSPLECYFQYKMLGNHLDGGSSRVYCFHPEVANNRVLKLTSCDASRELLKLLYAQQLKRSKIKGLPRVTQSLGMCARDDDYVEYHGFILERLRRAQTLKEAKMESHLIQAVRCAMHDASATAPNPLHWSASLAAATQLADSNIFGLGGAFRALRKVIAQCEAYLDLEMPGNILFALDGEICLADPVAMTGSLKH